MAKQTPQKYSGAPRRKTRLPLHAPSRSHLPPGGARKGGGAARPRHNPCLDMSPKRREAEVHPRLSPGQGLCLFVMGYVAIPPSAPRALLGPEVRRGPFSTSKLKQDKISLLDFRGAPRAGVLV